MGEQKFAGYLKLVEACGEPGCPVCHCLVSDSHGYLDALLHEQVTDPDTRRSIREAWGFCNWHTWMLLEVEHGRFGASIIYEDLVALALRSTERLGERAGTSQRHGWLAALGRWRRSPTVTDVYRKRARCPACVNTADGERR